MLRVEAQLRYVVEQLPGPARRDLLRILTLPDAERAEEIGAMYCDGRFVSLAELVIDLEAEPAARVLVVGELRELERKEDQA